MTKRIVDDIPEPTDEELQSIAAEEEQAFRRGIRIQVATQLLAGLLANGRASDEEDLVAEALKFADLLIEQVAS